MASKRQGCSEGSVKFGVVKPPPMSFANVLWEDVNSYWRYVEAVEGENINQFFSYDRLVSGGLRVSSVRVGYAITGPGPSRFGEDENISSRLG